MEVHVTVKVDKVLFAENFNVGKIFNSPQMIKAYKAWAVVYRAAMQERFNTFSRGGGDWAPLAQSTIDARRHGGKGNHKRGKRALKKAIEGGGGQVTILRDTGLLFMALSPAFGQPGQLESIVENGIEVGFGGTSGYPDGKATISDIAGFHQKGNKNLPKREILVEPPVGAIDTMKAIAVKAVEDYFGALK